MQGGWLQAGGWTVGVSPVWVPVAVGPPWQTCPGQSGSCGGREGAPGSGQLCLPLGPGSRTSAPLHPGALWLQHHCAGCCDPAPQRESVLGGLLEGGYSARGSCFKAVFSSF